MTDRPGRRQVSHWRGAFPVCVAAAAAPVRIAEMKSAAAAYRFMYDTDSGRPLSAGPDADRVRGRHRGKRGFIMTSKATIEAFLGQETLALAGVSRGGKKFGNAVLRDLSGKGYEILPVHPDAAEIDGVRCYPSLAELPKPAGGLVVVVPPDQTERLVQEAHEAGIDRVWMQQGAESDAAIRYCQEHAMDVVHGECIMMFAEPQGFHKFHRWLWGLLGKLPKEGT
jgi:predicted CoA-binding protein